MAHNEVPARLDAAASMAAAGIPDEDWGYVEVRPGCHLFWWLYGKQGSSPEQRTSEPIIQWHQGEASRPASEQSRPPARPSTRTLIGLFASFFFAGGPGASSTGFGNFEEIGVLDVNLDPRNTTWASQANLLFVVSACFSVA